MTLKAQEVYDEMHKAILEATDNLIRNHNIVCDQLTEDQLAKAFVQALACGDFQKLVVADGYVQSVVYIPFSREQELLSEIKKLRDLLEKHGIKERRT